LNIGNISTVDTTENTKTDNMKNFPRRSAEHYGNVEKLKALTGNPDLIYKK